MKRTIAALIAAALAGCASFDQPAVFALEDYPGATSFERTLWKTNLELNRLRACGANRLCQTSLPSREELAAAGALDCKGYAMGKAYALQDAGVNESRMQVALMQYMGTPHVVLVVDNRYVLDNMDSTVRPLAEYERFSPVLASLPADLMARKSGQPKSTVEARIN